MSNNANVNLNIIWFKTDANAIIPTKKPEDAGFDVYTIDQEVTLRPHETRLFRTGLKYFTNDDYWLHAVDRGSTGSRGIHCHCGICDKGYRGEIFICLNNANDYPVKFTSAIKDGKPVFKDGQFLYPTSKGIAQLIPIKMPAVNSNVFEGSDADWEKFLAENDLCKRGSGALGSSGK